MNWGLLALFAVILAGIAISNVWLRNRAKADGNSEDQPKSTEAD